MDYFIVTLQKTIKHIYKFISLFVPVHAPIYIIFWEQYFSTAIPPSIAMNNKAENNITFMTSFSIQGSVFNFV